MASPVSPLAPAQFPDMPPVAGVKLYRIGEIAADGYWIARDGKRERLEPEGYEHHLGTPPMASPVA